LFVVFYFKGLRPFDTQIIPQAIYKQNITTIELIVMYEELSYALKRVDALILNLLFDFRYLNPTSTVRVAAPLTHARDRLPLARPNTNPLPRTAKILGIKARDEICRIVLFVEKPAKHTAKLIIPTAT